jgi:DNA-binding NtrC family response regulator
MAVADQRGTVKTSILYFDDEPQMLSLFLAAFEGEYDVRVALTLGEARSALKECPAEIVISDQSMPEITGTEFLAEVARDYPRSYRIMLTGSMVVGEAIPELRSGIVHLFLAKPWSLDGMMAALERVIIQASIRRFSV